MMSKAKGKEIYIITAVVAVVLIVAWYFLLFSPKRQELSDLDSQISSAQAALSKATQDVATLESYKKTAPQSRAEIVRIGKMLPAAEGMPGLMVELSRSEKDSGVTIVSYTPGDYTPGTPFGTQKLALTVEGRYFDIEDFLYRVEQYTAFRNTSFHVTGRLLHVQSLVLTKAATTTTGTSTTTSPLLSATINLVGYTYAAAAAAPAATTTTTTTAGAQ